MIGWRGKAAMGMSLHRTRVRAVRRWVAEVQRILRDHTGLDVTVIARGY